MQLVPILSTIILVGTLATFILAVFAYILYKVRERRAREEAPQQEAATPEPHVLMAPQPIQAPMPPEVAVPAVPSYIAPTTTVPPRVVLAPEDAAPPEPVLVAEEPMPIFWEYTDEGFIPVQPGVDTHAEDEEGVDTAPGRGAGKEEDGFAWL